MKVPPLTPVQSSNIDAIGHSKDGLWIKFKSGGIYRYPEAPRTALEEGLKAESVGTWFRSKVMGIYRHAKYDA